MSPPQDLTANTKYLIPSKGGPLTACNTPKPTILLKSKEVLIRVKAVAINPADCKMIDSGHRVTSWPLVPGLDGAGVVEAVGSEVDSFVVGNRVLATFVSGNRGASFQKFAVVDEKMVAKIPGHWPFEEAAGLGVCYMTAIIALGIGLQSNLPFLRQSLPTKIKPGFNRRPVLILGGSSALGAATIQLLRLAAPHCTILTTSSPKHHYHLTANLGATAAYDRNSRSLIEDIKLATEGYRGVDAIIDAVGAARTDGRVFNAFDPNGSKRYAQVWTGDEEIEVPDGVESVLFRGRDLSKLQGGDNAMASLQALLEKRRYKLPLPVRMVGYGLEGLERGLELMRKGVSGEKLVVGL